VRTSCDRALAHTVSCAAGTTWRQARRARASPRRSRTRPRALLGSARNSWSLRRRWQSGRLLRRNSPAGNAGHAAAFSASSSRKHVTGDGPRAKKSRPSSESPSPPPTPAPASEARATPDALNMRIWRNSKIPANRDNLRTAAKRLPHSRLRVTPCLGRSEGEVPELLAGRPTNPAGLLLPHPPTKKWSQRNPSPPTDDPSADE
jgi:hypothetical protein